MQFFDAATTEEALQFGRLIPALRQMFASSCVVPSRHVHSIASAGVEHFTSLIMPAWLEGRYYGIKTVNIAPGNDARGLPALHSSYVLFDAITGAPLALIDGDQITARRTVAASALAASWLARPDSSRLLVVGAGQLARLLPHAYRVVLPIEHVTVWARSFDRAASVVERLRADGFSAVAAHHLEAAVRDADIVSCATPSTRPLIRGRWLRPDSHLDLIGSFTPAMREADDECFAGAAIFVDTEEALQKSGDLLGPISRGVMSDADLRGTLSALARGEAKGRQPSDGRTVFKSVGTALEDLAAAIEVFEGRR
jgi:ornithine cyclodeaminase/alanine dehydrogenase-like protein (mu-crystallin family)